MVTTREDCLRLDHADPLRSARSRFALPPGEIYLDGNSLGALPVDASAGLNRTIDVEWGRNLITSWNAAGWFDLPLSLGDRVGSLIGAAPGQTAVCDNTSINLFKAIHCALAMQPERDKLIAHKDDFPTDLYIIEGAVSSAGRDIEVVLIEDETELASHFDSRTAVAILSHVNYKSARLLDMAAITRDAHEAGALVVWDLCHSAGALPVALDGAEADFAIGCTYKYLNGGPGSPAYIYAATRHHERLSQPLTGWWSHRAPFAFEHRYQAGSGIRRMLTGTQSVLSMRGVESGLDTFNGISLGQLQKKSRQLCSIFIELVNSRCAEYGIRPVGPASDRNRGSHVSLQFDQGYSVVQAMIARGVTGDFRAPDLMRFGFAPLYIRYQDVWQAVEVMLDCLQSEPWLDSRFNQINAVT